MDQERRRRRRRKFLCFMDTIFVFSVFANSAQIYFDKQYWQEAPYPFYLFLLIQILLLYLMVRIPMSKASNTFTQIAMLLISISLIVNTILGLVWLIKSKKEAESENYIKTEYLVESIILLAIPIAIAVFFIIVITIVIVIWQLDRRRMQRFEEFEDLPEESGEVIAEMYISMLNKINYTKEAHQKYVECVICLKEFEEQEELLQIPSCQHIFHEGCLRKWFYQLQTCPMCRGNIIRIPNNNENQDFQVVRLSDEREEEEEEKKEQVIDIEVQNQLAVENSEEQNRQSVQNAYNQMSTGGGNIISTGARAVSQNPPTNQLDEERKEEPDFKQQD